jgi:hypothetical protein
VPEAAWKIKKAEAAELKLVVLIASLNHRKERLYSSRSHSGYLKPIPK